MSSGLQRAVDGRQRLNPRSGGPRAQGIDTAKDARDAGTRTQGSAARATLSTTTSTRSAGGAVTACCGAGTKTTPQTSLGTGHKTPNPGLAPSH